MKELKKDKDYKAIYEIKKMINYFHKTSSKIISLIYLLSNLQYYKYRDKNHYYYYNELNLNKDEEIEYIDYLMKIVAEDELQIFLSYINKTIRVKKHLYGKFNMERLEDYIRQILRPNTYSEFIELYEYVDDKTKKKILEIYEYELYGIVISDCDNVDMKYIDLILGDLIKDKETIYRSFYECENIIKHYSSNEDIVDLFKNRNNLPYSSAIKDAITVDNQYMFLTYFLNNSCYDFILSVIDDIDENETKYYNHIMDVLNCKPSNTLVEILDKTNLTTNKKQEILLLKTRKSCKI